MLSHGQHQKINLQKTQRYSYLMTYMRKTQKGYGYIRIADAHTSAYLYITPPILAYLAGYQHLTSLPQAAARPHFTPPHSGM